MANVKKDQVIGAELEPVCVNNAIMKEDLSTWQIKCCIHTHTDTHARKKKKFPSHAKGPGENTFILCVKKTPNKPNLSFTQTGKQHSTDIVFIVRVRFLTRL